MIFFSFPQDIEQLPMIYYTLSTVMLAGIREVLIISTPKDTPRFRDQLSNGSHIGMFISYAVQDAPNGLAEAFIIGKDSVCLVLGDNIFFLYDFAKLMFRAAKQKSGATIFGYDVTDPLRYKAFMNLIFGCKFVITDSGGIQEETTYLKIPCLTLRPNTERPVTINQGTNKLT